MTEMTRDEIVESIRAICAPLPGCRRLRDQIITAVEGRIDRLEETERERDTVAGRYTAHMQRELELEARLAKVPALVEALTRIGNFAAEGAPTFSTVASTEAQIARDALAVWERDAAAGEA